MSDSTVSNSSVDNLLGGSEHKVTETRVPLDASQGALARGTVMAQTNTGKLVPYVSDGSDGANVFYAILAEDVADNASEQSVVAYLTGQFVESAVIFSGAGDIAGIRDDARLKGCFFVVSFDNDSV